MKAVETYGKMLIDRTTEEIFSNFARVWQELAQESQFRWVWWVYNNEDPELQVTFIWWLVSI